MKTAALIPAYNEEDGLGDTIDSLLAQEVPFSEIIVVDDGSTDRTAEIARSYGDRVTLYQPDENLGSKAKAQNYGLDMILMRPDWCRPDAVLPVDADTVFAPDYVKHIEKPFEDESVAIAAGCVLTRHSKTVWEKGRLIEYLAGFHWFREVQQAYNAPLVCSGCCSSFRMTYLQQFGGFPERTIVEDIDYTWSQQILGRRAVYVREAVAYAAEPISLKYISKQLYRWKSGYFQNVRQHWWPMMKEKKALALWVNVALIEILMSPLTLLLPILWILLGHTWESVAGWTIAGEAMIVGAPVAYGTWKRKLNPWHVLKAWPSFYVLKMLNFYYDAKCGFNELILVPLGVKQAMLKYEKGRAGAETAQENKHRKPRNWSRIRLDYAFGAAGASAACMGALFWTTQIAYGAAGLLLAISSALVAPWARKHDKYLEPEEAPGEITQEVSLAEVYLAKVADDPTMPVLGDRVF